MSGGVAMEDRERDEALEVGGPGLVRREGLWSDWPLLREWLPTSLLVDDALRGCRMGDESLDASRDASRDAKGDGPIELFADDCLEF